MTGSTSGVAIVRDILQRLDAAHVDAVALRVLGSRETFIVPSLAGTSEEFDRVMGAFADHVSEERFGIPIPEALRGKLWEHDRNRFAQWYGNKQTAGSAFRRGPAPRLDRPVPFLRHGVLDRLHDEQRRALPTLPPLQTAFFRDDPVRAPVFEHETSYKKLPPFPCRSWMSATYMPPFRPSSPSFLEPRTVLPPVPSSSWARAELERLDRNLYGPAPSLDAMTAFAALQRSARSSAGMVRALDEYALFLSDRAVQQYHESIFCDHRLDDLDQAGLVAEALLAEYGPILFPGVALPHPALISGDIKGLLAGLAAHLREIEPDLRDASTEGAG